jgi:hypothetical protein
MWVVARRDIPPDDPVWRRFGRDHDKPCRDPQITTCAMWKCQIANECQLYHVPGARHGTNGPARS